MIEPTQLILGELAGGPRTQTALNVAGMRRGVDKPVLLHALNELLERGAIVQRVKSGGCIYSLGPGAPALTPVQLRRGAARRGERRLMGPPVDHTGAAITAPKRPPSWKQWERLPMPRELLALAAVGRTILFHERWHLRRRLVVVSAVELVEFKGAPTWQFHVSVSAAGARANDEQVARALRDFGMLGAEEDNHHRHALARHFWRNCAAAPGDETQCECKADEETVVMPDGYTYQTPRDPEASRRQDDELLEVLRRAGVRR
jgi:hypothetical protein